jgi:RNA polymerase sigma-70 factor (ECF subfamily)
MSGSPTAAEDITQDAFMALLRHPDRFDPARGTLRAFLLGIARNLALKHWRAAHRFEPLDDEAAVAEPLDLGRGDVGETVGRAVRALRPLQREVVILAEYEGLTLAEIARAVDADVGTVKSRLHRARENLRRLLAPLRSHQPTTG